MKRLKFVLLFATSLFWYIPQVSAQSTPDPIDDLGIIPIQKIDIQGQEVDIDNPPKGYKTYKDLGVMAHETLKPQRVHAWAPPFNSSWHSRTVITPKGDFLLVTSAGRGHMWHDKRHNERHPDSKPNDLIMYRSSDKGQTWHGPFLPFKVNYGHNTSVFLVPKGSSRIYMFSTEVSPEWAKWPDGGIAMRYSDDDGWTWSKPKRIQPVNSPDYTGHSHIQMTETDNGTWLLGSYHVGTLTRPEGREDRQYILRSTDKGETWTLIPDKEPNGFFIPEYNYMIEGRALALDGPNALFWGRAPGGHSWQYRSNDDGLTWTGPEPVKLTHPDAPPMVWKLADGKTLIAIIHNRYNAENPKHDHQARSELWFTTSTDNAKTWSEPRFIMANIAEPGGSLKSPGISYDHLLVDGENLHLFIDWQFRQILHFKFKESDIDKLPTLEELKKSIKANQE